MTDVLILEDDRALLGSLCQSLELAEMGVIAAASFVEGKDHITPDFPGVILSDIRMPGRDGFAVLAHAKSVDPEIPVVFLTGEGDVPTAVRAMTEGAWDFLEKPIGPDHLVEVLSRALEHRRLVRRSREMQARLERSDAAAVNFPGGSPATQLLRDGLRAAASGRGHVHLFGPDGAGKRLAANTIFTLSPTSKRFVTLSLAQTSPLDIRSLDLTGGPIDLSVKELDRARPDAALALAERLEADGDIRVLSSARVSLDRLRAMGRLDPLQQLGQREVEVPNLARRKPDIPDIFETLVRQTVRTLNADMPHLPKDVLATMAARSWPGNLPELRRVAHSYALSGRVGPLEVPAMPLAGQMDAFERAVLQDTLARHRGRATAAANALGLPRKTLYDRLARHGLKPADYKT